MTTTEKTLTKPELVAMLATSTGRKTADLRRLTVAELRELAAQKPKGAKAEKPSPQAAMDRVAGLLGLTVGDVVKMSAYSRASATSSDGSAFTLYRNSTNVGVVPKGLSPAAARELLTGFQKITGGKLRDSKAELLVPDEEA